MKGAEKRGWDMARIVNVAVQMDHISTVNIAGDSTIIRPTGFPFATAP